MLRKHVRTKSLVSWLKRGANHPYQGTNRQNGENCREAEKQNRSQASKDVSRRPHRVSLSGLFSHGTAYVKWNRPPLVTAKRMNVTSKRMSTKNEAIAAA